jgi:hypothetical protein
MSYKLTKELKARLAEFAAAITPPNNRPGAARPGSAVFPASQAPAVNHERRLLAKYEAGGWPAVELYLQPFLTPAGYARQLMERAADAKAAAADAAPTDFHPLAAQLQGFDVPVSGLLTEATAQPVVQLATAGTPGYENALVGTGAPGAFGVLHAIEEGLRTCEPLLIHQPAPEVREFTKLCQRWEAEADALHIGLDFSTGPAVTGVVVHRPGAAPGELSCEPRLPYDATAATRRLGLAYEAGVAEPGDIYRAHQEVQEAPRALCVGNNTDTCAACLQAGPGCITADFIPRYSCDCGQEPAPSLAGRLFPLTDACGGCRGECLICLNN